jgi:hypothetical protein
LVGRLIEGIAGKAKRFARAALGSTLRCNARQKAADPKAGG